MSRLARRAHVDHAKTAANLRAKPGHWLPIGEYRSTSSATGIALMIRTAPDTCNSSVFYAPAGAFEARMELTDTGTQVLARYIGLAVVSPDGCRWCGITRRGHARQWKQPVGWHTWEQPEQGQILARMLARRAARLNAAPPVFHAATGWAPDATGEEGIPFCADCGTESCRQWIRIQTRLDQRRFGLPRRVRRVRKEAAGGWGGDQQWPF